MAATISASAAAARASGEAAAGSGPRAARVVSTSLTSWELRAPGLARFAAVRCPEIAWLMPGETRRAPAARPKVGSSRAAARSRDRVRIGVASGFPLELGTILDLSRGMSALDRDRGRAYTGRAPHEHFRRRPAPARR